MPPSESDVRDRLRLPVAIAILAVWVAGSLTAIVRSDVQVFVIATGPFSLLAGYLFTDGLLRRSAKNGHG